MKTINKQARYNAFTKNILTIFPVFLSVSIFSQTTKKVNINITANNGRDFFNSTWVWVAALLIFLILLIALVRSGKHKNA